MTESRKSKWQHCPCGYACFSHQVVTHCPGCGEVLRPGQRPQLTIVDGKLVCPYCNQSEFMLFEEGYARMDRVRVIGDKLICTYDGFTDDGDGAAYLQCVAPNCKMEKFFVPEGLEIEYD